MWVWNLVAEIDGGTKLRVFENTALRRIFEPKRDELKGERRRLHNQQLYDLYSSPNIIQVMKSRRMRWVGHVVHMGERRGAYRVLVSAQVSSDLRGYMCILACLLQHILRRKFAKQFATHSLILS